MNANEYMTFQRAKEMLRKKMYSLKWRYQNIRIPENPLYKLPPKRARKEQKMELMKSRRK